MKLSLSTCNTGIDAFDLVMIRSCLILLNLQDFDRCFLKVMSNFLVFLIVSHYFPSCFDKEVAVLVKAMAIVSSACHDIS